MDAPNNALREATAGLWRHNMTLVQLLGLCPLLAVSTSAVNGIALGIATTAVLVIANLLMVLMRRVLLQSVRIPLYLLLTAALVTVIDLLTNAVLDDLHEQLGIFISLIVVNCGLLAHAETVASRRSIGFVLLSSLATGGGFLFALTALGALREAFGRGTLLAGIEMLGGAGSTWLTVDLPSSGMLVAILPPGAFFGMAMLLALRNRLFAAPNQPSAGKPALPEAPR